MYITHKSQQKTGASKKFAYSPKNKFELNNLSMANVTFQPFFRIKQQLFSGCFALLDGKLTKLGSSNQGAY